MSKIFNSIFRKRGNKVVESTKFIDAPNKLPNVADKVATIVEATELKAELEKADTATLKKIDELLTNHETQLSDHEQILEKAEKTIREHTAENQRWTQIRQNMAMGGLIEMDKPVMKQTPTSKLTGGSFYHVIVKGDKGYYIAKLKSGEVVIKADDSLGKYRSLVYRGKFNLRTAGFTDREKGKAQLQQYDYVNLSQADFDNIIKNKPAFKDILSAYDMPVRPQWDLDASERTPGTVVLFSVRNDKPPNGFATRGGIECCCLFIFVSILNLAPSFPVRMPRNRYGLTPDALTGCGWWIDPCPGACLFWTGLSNLGRSAQFHPCGGANYLKTIPPRRSDMSAARCL